MGRCLLRECALQFLALLGISIGVAYGVAYFLVNRRMSPQEQAVFTSSTVPIANATEHEQRSNASAPRRSIAGPNFEWLVVFFALTSFYFGLASPLSLSLRPWMQNWGGFYASAAILFGLVYYLVNRRTAVDGSLYFPQSGNIGAIGAVLLALVSIVSFFLPTIASSAGQRLPEWIRNGLL